MRCCVYFLSRRARQTLETCWAGRCCAATALTETQDWCQSAAQQRWIAAVSDQQSEIISEYSPDATEYRVDHHRLRTHHRPNQQVLFSCIKSDVAWFITGWDTTWAENERRLFIKHLACNKYRNGSLSAGRAIFVFGEFCKDPPCWPPCDRTVGVSVLSADEEAGEAWQKRLNAAVKRINSSCADEEVLRKWRIGAVPVEVPVAECTHWNGEGLPYWV